jgi:hypothetical protein
MEETYPESVISRDDDARAAGGDSAREVLIRRSGVFKEL